MKEFEEWPHNLRDTRYKAAGIFDELKTKVSEDSLELQDLAQIQIVIWHLSKQWGRSFRSPIIREGVDIIRLHFAKLFSVDQLGTRSRVYNRILETASSTQYFAGRNPAWGEDPEFEAYGMLGVYSHYNSRTI